MQRHGGKAGRRNRRRRWDGWALLLLPRNSGKGQRVAINRCSPVAGADLVAKFEDTRGMGCTPGAPSHRERLQLRVAGGGVRSAVCFTDVQPRQ